MLASEGLFHAARDMAKKPVPLYSLMVQQLSKQEEEHYHYDYHYEYGLRNLHAGLNMAGQLKRRESTLRWQRREATLMRVGQPLHF